tara:strand:- start:8417 stop:8917 length:501 start_codon:yes stop_codon:yes gene_type:complete
MSARTKKYILKAAKDSVNQKFTEQVEKMREQIDELYAAEGDCAEVDNMLTQLRAVEDEWHEWSLRAKKNKKKVGKRVEWTNQRDQAPMRTVNQDALADLRRARKEKAKAHVGVAWLYEGALVTKRGKSDMMIVTRISGESVECLKDGTTHWFRNVALRPADWMMED